MLGQKLRLIAVGLGIFVVGIIIGRWIFSGNFVLADGTISNAVAEGLRILFTPMFQGVAGLLPTIDVNSMPFQIAINRILLFGYQLGFIIPWTTIFACVWAMLSIRMASLLLKLVMWLAGLMATVISKILPGV